MTDPVVVRQVKRANEARLLVLPGVHSVGVGPKLVAGKFTGELAIKVYLVKKKSPAELTPGEIIPPEIGGVKTDIVEMEVPNLHADTSKERPLIFGTRITAKDAPEDGTVGMLALTGDYFKLVALTCQHVVAPPMGRRKSDLVATTPPGTPDPYNISFSGDNTIGSLVVVKMADTEVGTLYNAFWRTNEADTPATVAQKAIEAVNAIPDINVTAAPGANPGDVVISKAAGSNTVVGGCTVFDPQIPDPTSNLYASADGNLVTLEGRTDREYGLYFSWHSDGAKPTRGALASVVKGSSLVAVADALVAAVTDLAADGVTATRAGTSVSPTVTFHGAKIVTCLVAPDIRVGQPSDDFSSNCSLCCTDEIGRVIAARVDTDVALINLRQGLQYRAEIKGDSSIPQPHVAIKGIHAVTNAELTAGYTVHMRGAESLYRTGTVDALDVSSYSTNSSPSGGWTVLYRFYTGGIYVVGDGGRFSDAGDSGAAVFNDAGEVVGVLFGGGPSRSAVTPIFDITSTLGLTPETATALDLPPKTVNEAQGSLARVRADNDEVMGQVLAAHADISATAAGKELADAVLRNVQEVQTLVNTNARVATVWHRNAGPQLVQAVLAFLRDRTHRLPEQLEGAPLSHRLVSIQKALVRHGSPSLSADFERYAPRILGLIGLSFSEALEHMRGSLAGTQA
ncbi:MAG TPA: hypothetical protein VGM84_25285 [Steroidobacteraceae bacterium]|jgi:hypothetical protein